MTGGAAIWPSLPGLEPGWVWLVGAGPGDAALLTLGGYSALQQADVILHDSLIGPDVLALAHPEAVLELCGKRGGKPSPTQQEITDRLIAYAQCGKRVVRLKGGDPFMFGRGPEEALDLVRAGVPFRIVPGIAAGLGGLAYAGIPATARDTNDAVTFLTGHNLRGEMSDRINWDALAKSGTAIVAYMAIRTLPQLVQKLTDGGRSSREPVAVVHGATLPEQEVLESCLANVVDDVARAGIGAPALVVIGDIVRLRAGLDWLGALTGRKLCADPLAGESSDGRE